MGIKAKHKFAVQAFAQGDQLYLYGVLVGEALVAIPSGGLIHTGNVVHAAESYEAERTEVIWDAPDVSQWTDRTFDGYHRAGGSVGTANYWLVIPLVFCENRNVETIREAMVEQLGYGRREEKAIDIGPLIEAYRSGASEADIMATAPLTKPGSEANPRVFPNVDGIKFLTHDGGCGGIRQDSEVLCKLLAGYITSPNVAGATVLSLGCQNAQIPILQKALASRGEAG